MKTGSMVDRHTGAFESITQRAARYSYWFSSPASPQAVFRSPDRVAIWNSWRTRLPGKAPSRVVIQDREETANDAECINARRAASNVAARADEAQREQRDAESEILRAAASDRAARAQTAIVQAAVAARENAEAQYEAQWTQRIQVVATEAVSEVTYRSLVSTLSAASPAQEVRYAELPRPTLDFIELPASATPILPYVELPATVRRLEVAPKPVLEEISIPASVR